MQKRIVFVCEQKEDLQSDLCVCLHQVGFEPIIKHLVRSALKANVDEIYIVSNMNDKISSLIKNDKVRYLDILQFKGNGHAINCLDELKDKEGLTLVINGDLPFISEQTLLDLIETYEKSKNTLIYNELGTYAFDNKELFENLKDLRPNKDDGMYHLNDLALMIDKKQIFDLDSYESMVINNRADLVDANLILNEQQVRYWISNGVTILDPSSTYIGRDVEIDHDVIIYPNSYLEGSCVIKKDSIIGPNARIINSYIGTNSVVDSSRVINCRVNDNVTIGPFAHLRDNCEIGNSTRIGNFVEMKKVKFDQKSKCAHLTYLGDAKVGEKVNIGCGTITVNYDGKNKYETIIKDGAFIGSNSNLIAPITIGKNALVAAGSTITTDVSDGDMGIGRAKQINKAGFGEKYKNKEKK